MLSLFRAAPTCTRCPRRLVTLRTPHPASRHFATCPQCDIRPVRKGLVSSDGLDDARAQDIRDIARALNDAHFARPFLLIALGWIITNVIYLVGFLRLYGRPGAPLASIFVIGILGGIAGACTLLPTAFPVAYSRLETVVMPAHRLLRRSHTSVRRRVRIVTGRATDDTSRRAA